MEQICEEKSQLESKLTKKTHEAERWDMALSVVKQKIEEKKSKICEVRRIVNFSSIFFKF